MLLGPYHHAGVIYLGIMGLMALRVRHTPIRFPANILYTPVTLTMAPGGVETSVFQNTSGPVSASVEFSFERPWMRIFKFIVYPSG